MQRRFYLDTSIWRDYFEDRSDGVRPLGDLAFQFLKTCEKRRCTIFYSELVIRELRKDYSEEKIAQVFSSFGKFLAIAKISQEQQLEAQRLARLKPGSHESDILHAILARDNNAALITRDFHFECLKDIADIRAPEEADFC